MTIGFARLWHVFNMRDRNSDLINNKICRNPYVWGALIVCTGLLLAAVYLPGLATVLKTSDPGTEGWLLIGIASLSPLLVGQIASTISSHGMSKDYITFE